MKKYYKKPLQRNHYEKSAIKSNKERKHSLYLSSDGYLTISHVGTLKFAILISFLFLILIDLSGHVV